MYVQNIRVQKKKYELCFDISFQSYIYGGIWNHSLMCVNVLPIYMFNSIVILSTLYIANISNDYVFFISLVLDNRNIEMNAVRLNLELYFERKMELD